MDKILKNSIDIDQTNSIFQQPWWIESLVPGQYREVCINQGGEIIARMPYVIGKKYGFSCISMPPLTQTLGPWIRPSKAKYANQLAEQKDLLQELIGKLPQFDFFEQNFSPEITNWLPFYWKGFKQTTRYTYRIYNLQDLESVWAGFLPNIRTDIRKAQKTLKVRNDLSIMEFLKIINLTFKRQGLELPYSAELVQRMDNACVKYGARKMFFAQDGEGRIHAAIYLIWDKNTAYYLMGGGDPELRNSGATSLLMWEAIKFSASVTKVFDFEGSMLEPVERFFRAFGAKQCPYFTVSSMSKSYQIAFYSKCIFSILFGR